MSRFSLNFKLPLIILNELSIKLNHIKKYYLFTNYQLSIIDQIIINCNSPYAHKTIIDNMNILYNVIENMYIRKSLT